MKNYGYNPMQEESKYFKRKINFSKFIGFLFAALGIVGIVLLYLQKVDEWLSMIIILFSCACCFYSNGAIQGIRRGRKMQILNLIIAFAFFVAVVVFVVLGFIYGHISIKF